MAGLLGFISGRGIPAERRHPDGTCVWAFFSSDLMLNAAPHPCTISMTGTGESAPNCRAGRERQKLSDHACRGILPTAQCWPIADIAELSHARRYWGWLMRYALIATATFLLGLATGLAFANPPKWALSLIDSAYSDQCESGAPFGVRRGMSRRDVLRSFGMLTADFRSDWYIVDEALGLPPDAIPSPLWRPGRLPANLMHAEQWRTLRRGYGPGFEMIISFDADRVTCADVQYEILLP
jgi:hypothetical protein